MRKRRRWFCTLLVVSVTASLLWGCGGSKFNSAKEDGAAGYVPEAAETMAAAEAESFEQTQLDSWDGAEHNTEEYSYTPENSFLAVADAPLSTFAADVDTASYANIRRMVLAGDEVPQDAVRIEEMLNYFYYDYLEPQGDEPFSVTTWMGTCPWNEEHQILQVGLQAEKIEEDTLPPSNLVFLIDVSGSMDSPDKLDLVKRAFLLLTENLKPQDSISIVTYASSDAVLLDGATGEDKTQIMAVIENLWAGGSTAGSEGIETAYELAEKHFIEGGNNRVILATDGDLNVGITSEGQLTRLIQKKKETGIFLSVLGFGTGNIKDNKMEALADNGNGQYAYVDSIMEAKRILVEEMGGTLFTVAKDVKFQVEFNPAMVKGYRLIGYENRVMADQDFEDDTKDGGEVGAGHRVTVLYELIPSSSEEEIEGIPLKYQPETEGGQDQTEEFAGEYLTVKIRYKEPDGDQSKLLEYPVDSSSWQEQMPEDMAFAVSVAETGMLLKESEYAGDSSFEDVIKRLEGLEQVKDDVYKQEFLYLVKRMEKL